MLRFKIFGIDIYLSFLFFAVVTIYLILDRTGFGCCGLFAAVTHELGHIAAYCLVGSKPSSVALTFEGMRLVTSNQYLTVGKELFTLLAGCGVNFVLCILFLLSDGNIFFRFALSQFVIGGFNLIPIGGLDGALTLKRVLSLFFSFRMVHLISLLLSWGVVIPLLFCGIFLFLTERNITLLITGGFLIISLLKSKKSARLICNR